MELIITLIIAGIIGWVASVIMKTDSQMGIVANVVAGLVGGFIGNTLLGFVAPNSYYPAGLNLLSIVFGLLGACVAIFVYQLIDGQRRI